MTKILSARVRESGYDVRGISRFSLLVRYMYHYLNSNCNQEIFLGVSVTSSPVTGQRGVRLPEGEISFC